MKNLLCILLFCFPVLSFAQQEAAQDSLEKKNVDQFFEIADSLNSNYGTKPGGLGELLITTTDTLTIYHKLDSLQRLSFGLDSLKLKSKLDSLQQLRLPTEKVQTKIDSIQSLLAVQRKVNEQISSLNSGMDQAIHKVSQPLQGKIDKATALDGVSREGIADLQEQTGISLSTQLPEIKGLKLEEIKGLETPGLEIPKIEMPDLGQELPDLAGLGNLNTEKLSQLGDLPPGADLGKLEELRKEGLPEMDKADKLAEEQFLKTKEGQAFQEKLGGSQSGMGELKQLSGKDYLKEQAKTKIYQATKDHFKGQAEKLDLAREQLAKYKGRFEKVESVKKMPKGFFKLNPLRGKPWQERVLMGSLWGFGKQEQFRIDVGPTLAWRFNDKLSAGLGYQYRLGVGKEKPWVNNADKVHGYLFFSDFQFKKGFFARLLFQDLNTCTSCSFPTQKSEVVEQEWVKGLSIGIGKSYTFYKSVKGFSLLQYNILHSNRKTPYAQPYQAKIGFYIKGKKIFKKGEGRQKEKDRTKNKDQ